ncbi:MAG: DNA-binding response regulator [Eisenbergiella massiliensis]
MAYHYLIKPVDEEELVGCLEKVKEKLDGSLTAVPEAEKEEEGYRSEGRLLKEILLYIQENYRTVTQQQLADEFSLSVSSVSQMIKRRTGKSYSDHLLEIRISKAQELLRLTNESIEEISEKVGYSDYFYFLKVFKKATESVRRLSAEAFLKIAVTVLYLHSCKIRTFTERKRCIRKFRLVSQS